MIPSEFQCEYNQDPVRNLDELKVDDVQLRKTKTVDQTQVNPFLSSLAPNERDEKDVNTEKTIGRKNGYKIQSNLA